MKIKAKFDEDTCHTELISVNIGIRSYMAVSIIVTTVNVSSLFMVTGLVTIRSVNVTTANATSRLTLPWLMFPSGYCYCTFNLISRIILTISHSPGVATLRNL